jgi:hypothetical protein
MRRLTDEELERYDRALERALERKGPRRRSGPSWSGFSGFMRGSE